MPFGYWYFFTRFDAASVIGNHLESHFHLMYPENTTVWNTSLAPLSRARAWVEADTRTTLPSFLDHAYKTHWLEWMSRPNATVATLNVYNSQWQGVNIADDASLSDKDWFLHVPVLTIDGGLDAIGPPALIEGTKAWAKAGYENKTLEGGHWLMLELPEQVNKLLLEFGRA